MRARLVSSLLALGAAAAAFAADPVALRSLFPSEADVYADQPGLVRLELPAEVLAACRPDLSNVRLFDADGSEVPFLVDAARRGAVREVESVGARVLEVRREEDRREGRPNLRHELFTITGPGRAARSGAWDLVVEPVGATFVARIEVRSAAGRAARGSIFRIYSPRRAEKVRIPVGAAAPERLEVVLEHEQSSWLEPSFRFESATSLEFGAGTSIPLEILSSASSGGTTVIELARPRGVVPEALRVDTATATFDRRITVQDEGPGRDPAALASGNVFRLAPGTGVEELGLAMRPARGDRIRIVIDDGDSPPLGRPSFSAVFGRPSLVASLTAPAGPAPAAVLRFGGSRARVPRYDLAGLRPGTGREVYGRRAEALVRLYDPATIGLARLGPVRPNPSYDASPALAFAMRAGATIDTRLWTMRRSLEVREAAEGLTRVRLGPDDLARLRPDLGDLRIVDASERQWPYLIDRDVARVDVAFTVAGASSKAGATTFELQAATAPVVVDRVLVDPDAPFFDRPFVLSGETEDGATVELGRGRLARRAGDAAPVTLETPRTRVRRLELRVEDGDDAPLALRSVRAPSPVADAYVAASPGAYWVLLGSDDATPPSYEIETVRDVVLALGADERPLGPLDPNPRFRAAARLVRGAGRERALLWGAIIAAVVVLAALTLRLARREKA